MATKQEFVLFMAKLAAAVPRFAPNVADKTVLATWYDELGSLSTEALTAIYKHAAARLDAFPSIAQCLGIIGQSPLTEDDKGREVADRIWTAIGRIGASVGTDWEWKKKRLEDMVGPIGMDVIQLNGGWNSICQVASEDNAGMLKAQWRESAIIVAKKGGIGKAPQYDKPAIGGRGDDIIKRLSKGENPEDLLPARR